nr:Arm DNA-binding domain-containing protein [[Pseudomonas] sp. BICA1-14]
MLTDTALRKLKPKAKPYKASDRDGMYVTVSPGGTVTFRYDYRLNGRRETLTIGRYGPAGISLAMAREKLLDAKRQVAQGISPSLEKQRAKRRLTAAKAFGDMLKRWLNDARIDMLKLLLIKPAKRPVTDRAVVIENAKRKINGVPGGGIIEGRYGVWSR